MKVGMKISPPLKYLPGLTAVKVGMHVELLLGGSRCSNESDNICCGFLGLIPPFSIFLSTYTSWLGKLEGKGCI